MSEFSHEELQQVIHKYDAGLQKMRASIAEKNEKVTHLEQQYSKLSQQWDDSQEMQEMQAEENKTLKQHVAQFNTENLSLKNLVKVLETDTEKLDDLEAQLEQAREQYQKEKELNV